MVRETLPDVHIHNVAVGPDPEMDKANTVFMRCVDQVKQSFGIKLTRKAMYCFLQWQSHALDNQFLYISIWGIHL